jgi:putative transposase
MARLPRLSLAGYPHWVAARGNNGQSVFITDQDHRFFLTCLGELSKTHDVAVHAYVLLANQFQMLLTPSLDKALPAFMQSVGRKYVQAYNRSHGRSGTLWEGRYRSTILQASSHLLDCMVWMDTAPVRALLCTQPGDFAWSSCRHYLGLHMQGFITPHPQTWALGNTPFAREAAYAQRLHAGLPEAVLAHLNTQAVKGWVLGDSSFVQELQALTARRLLQGKAGRPVKKALE